MLLNIICKVMTSWYLWRPSGIRGTWKVLTIPRFTFSISSRSSFLAKILPTRPLAMAYSKNKLCLTNSSQRTELLGWLPIDVCNWQLRIWNTQRSRYLPIQKTHHIINLNTQSSHTFRLANVLLVSYKDSLTLIAIVKPSVVISTPGIFIWVCVVTLYTYTLPTWTRHQTEINTTCYNKY